VSELTSFGSVLGKEELAAFAGASSKSPRAVEGRREEAARARAALDAVLGAEAVVDAAAVASFFHVMTRGVDTAGHTHVSTNIFKVMGIIMRLKNMAIDWARWLLGPILSWR